MTKIDGKYEQFWTENLLKQINGEDSITKRHHLISRYLHQREKQVEKILANIEDDDIDLTLVIEQLWEDLELAHKQIQHTIDRSDFYADYYKLDKWDADKKKLKLLITNGGDFFETENCEQKPAWSEKDTFKVQRICKYLNEAKYYTDITEVRECMEWLKSLKQRIEK